MIRMKNKILIITAVLLIIGLSTFFLINNKTEELIKEDVSDSIKFSKEYNDVPSDNVFVYRSVDEIIDIMKHGVGVVYLGYPECPWCQSYVKYLNEVAKEVGLSKIYYCNTKEVKESSYDKYQELISLLHGHLQYNDEGKEWIYVPNVSFHNNGKIIENDYETSKDTHNLKDPNEYWTEEEISELKNKLKPAMQQIVEASGICTGCNK